MKIITKTIKDFAPSEHNRRNSEGDFITLNDGRILFIYTRYGENSSDGGAADLYGSISADNGESFSEPFPVFSRERVNADNVMSVTLRRMANGDIGLFFLKKEKPIQCRLYLARSSDEGKSFGEPVACIPHKGYFVVNNDRVTRLESGRLIAPAAYTNVLFDDDMNGTFGIGTAYFYASDDDGISWRKLGECQPPQASVCKTGLQEPLVVELKNHTLWALFRTDLGRQYEAYSVDGGESWTAPQPSQFTAPTSPISIKRLKDGRLFAVWNPVPVYNGRSENVDGVWTGARTPLAAAFSDNDGKSFGELHIIENDERRGYAYTAIHELENGEILLAHCAGGVEDKCMLNRLRITKLKFEE